jgi:hypothetical protein
MLESLLIIVPGIVVLVVTTVYLRHKKRAFHHNYDGLCARCGTILTPLDNGQIVVDRDYRYATNIIYARVCRKCEVRGKRIEKIFAIVVITIIVCFLLFMISMFLLNRSS